MALLPYRQQSPVLHSRSVGLNTSPMLPAPTARAELLPIPCITRVTMSWGTVREHATPIDAMSMIGMDAK
jgi:hypothetical protein